MCTMNKCTSIINNLLLLSCYVHYFFAGNNLFRIIVKRIVYQMRWFYVCLHMSLCQPPISDIVIPLRVHRIRRWRVTIDSSFAMNLMRKIGQTRLGWYIPFSFDKCFNMLTYFALIQPLIVQQWKKTERFFLSSEFWNSWRNSS